MARSNKPQNNPSLLIITRAATIAIKAITNSINIVMFMTISFTYIRMLYLMLISAIRNLRLKTLLSPVLAKTDFQSLPVVHASSTDIYIHYVSCMPEVPVSTCVRLSPVPMCLTVHFYKLIGFVQKAKPFTFDIQSCIDISIMHCTTVWTRPFTNA